MFRHLVVTFLIVLVIYVSLLVVLKHPFVTNAAEPESIDIVTPEMNKGVHKVKKDSDNGAVTIYGLSKVLNLSNAEKEIKDAWNEFLGNKSLQNNVDWGKGNIIVYALYNNFSNDMSKATLTIGYNGNDLLLNTDATSGRLPIGVVLNFQYDSRLGTAENKAWEAAYLHNNLIERHSLDTNGEIISSDVIVVK